MSFLKELAALAQPAPALPDLEDDDYDGTSSKALKSSKFVEEGDASEAPIRKRIIGLSLNTDGKYGGEKISRAEMFGDSSQMSGLAANVLDSDNEMEDEDDDENEIDQDQHEQDSESENEEADSIRDEDEVDAESSEGSISESEVKRVLAGEDSYGEGSDIEDDDGSNIDDEEDEESQGESDNDANDDENVEDQDEKATMKDLVSDIDREKQQKKAAAIKSQLTVWDQLLYIKIKLQAATRAYNQLPRGDLYNELMRSADEETKKNMQLAHRNAQKLIQVLLDAEHMLLSSSPLTKSIVGGTGGKGDSDDEEIESSEDEKDDENEKDDSDHNDDDLEDEEEDDNEDDVDDGEKGVHTNKTSEANWKSANKRLESNDEKFKNFRDSTLRKWDERTRVTASRTAKDVKKDFSAFEKGGVLQQINKIMADKSRLVKRSMTKRSDAERIGGDKQTTEDPEIFDDDDFYQVLLREMMERKSNSANDSVSMTRHYIEMQKLLKQRKSKKIANGTSKDHACKYVVIPKLVNFHPARPELISWSHESRNELFKSLFR